MWLIDNTPPNSLAFIHLKLPHWPFVFKEDGTYFGHSGTNALGPVDLEGYRRNLQFLDLVVSRITSRLRTAGKFDQTLLILTSDHGLTLPPQHQDPDMTRVPLIVKLPGQERGYIVDTPVTNNQLGPLIEQVLRGEVDEQGWLRSIESSRGITSAP